jgi:hypothetical protein
MSEALTITLPAPLADDVRAAAQARGLSPEEYVRQQLAEGIAFDAEADDLSWDEDERRMSEPGENIPLDAAFDELEARLAAKRAGK